MITNRTISFLSARTTSLARGAITVTIAFAGITGSAFAEMPNDTSKSAVSAPAGYHEDMMATMKKMDQSMKSHQMKNPDHDFAAMMIPHHQGAIDMAKVQLKYGKDEALRKMATEIIAAQEKEIQQLKESLKRLGGDSATTHSMNSM